MNTNSQCSYKVNGSSQRQVDPLDAAFATATSELKAANELLQKNPSGEANTVARQLFNTARENHKKALREVTMRNEKRNKEYQLKEREKTACVSIAKGMREIGRFMAKREELGNCVAMLARELSFAGKLADQAEKRAKLCQPLTPRGASRKDWLRSNGVGVTRPHSIIHGTKVGREGEKAA